MQESDSAREKDVGCEGKKKKKKKKRKKNYTWKKLLITDCASMWVCGGDVPMP